METTLAIALTALIAYFGALYIVVKEATKSKETLEELRMSNKNLTEIIEKLNAK